MKDIYIYNICIILYNIMFLYNIMYIYIYIYNLYNIFIKVLAIKAVYTERRSNFESASKNRFNAHILRSCFLLLL